MSYHINVLKYRRFREEFFRVHQGAVKLKLSPLNPNAEFPKAAKQIFLHLTGHTGLLSSFSARRM